LSDVCHPLHSRPKFNNSCFAVRPSPRRYSELDDPPPPRFVRNKSLYRTLSRSWSRLSRSFGRVDPPAAVHQRGADCRGYVTDDFEKDLTNLPLRLQNGVFGHTDPFVLPISTTSH
jgi:hypothetical protein